MQQAVSQVSPEVLPDLAEHFAIAQEPEMNASEAVTTKGRTLASRGTREIPACAACHGPSAELAQVRTPELAGQNRTYLEGQLRLWRDGIQKGSAKMSAAARALTDEDIAVLAEWYASLEANGRTSE